MATAITRDDATGPLPPSATACCDDMVACCGVPSVMGGAGCFAAPPVMRPTVSYIETVGAAGAGAGAVSPMDCDESDHATPDIPTTPLDLAALMEQLALQLSHETHLPLSARQKIKSLLGLYDVSTGELDRYSFFDPHKRYTRNLIAQDEHFTLMLLCWNPGKESPIHDHPCLGCWMRVVSGSVVETRYRKDTDTNTLMRIGEMTGVEGATIYIDDSIGLHKVANPSPAVPARTLHLYCPPFHKCKIWMDEGAPADKFCTPTVTYHSEYGTLVSYEMESALCK